MDDIFSAPRCFDLPAHPLAELFPMLPEAEVRELADDIVTYGQRVPIIVLDGMVLDGRNRLAACRFADVEPSFDIYEGDDPLGFVLSHNLHRRHLTTSQRAMVAAKISNLPRGRPGEKASNEAFSDADAASALSVSEASVERAKGVLRDGAEELQAAVERRELTVSAAAALASLPKAEQIEVLASADPAAIKTIAKQVRAEQQKTRHTVRLAHMEMVAERGRPSAPGKVERLYPVIYADPPWRFAVHSEQTGREKSAENHYPTMPTEQIAGLLADLGGVAARDAVCFLWATNPMLLDGLRTLQAWGFTYVHHWIWDKEVAGTGYWGRDRHELLLIGRRGDAVAPLPGTQPETVHRERKGPHSAKPGWFAEQIERLYPGIAKIELFCRSARPGWDVWGFQADGASGTARKPAGEPAEDNEDKDRRNPAGGPANAPSGGERPSVTSDELAEWKALGAIDCGVTVDGPLVDSLGERGLVVFGDGQIAAHQLTHEGQDRLRELDRKVSDASDGDGVNVVDPVDGEPETAAPETPAPASLIPADLRPGRQQHPTELTIGGMRKTGSGRLCFRADDDGYAWSYDIELKAHRACSGPYRGGYESLDECVGDALSFARSTLADWAEWQDSLTTDKHRAAARGGANWCVDKLAEWGLPA